MLPSPHITSSSPPCHHVPISSSAEDYATEMQNSIYPSLITMLLVYLAYSELRFQFHKRLYVQVSTAFAKKRTHFSLDSFQVQASRVKQLYFVLQKCTTPTDSVTALSAASLVTHGRRENLSFLFVHLFVPVWS